MCVSNFLEHELRAQLMRTKKSDRKRATAAENACVANYSFAWRALNVFEQIIFVAYFFPILSIHDDWRDALMISIILLCCRYSCNNSGGIVAMVHVLHLKYRNNHRFNR